MKRILLLGCFTMLLTSCGLFRKTIHEKSVASLNEKRKLLYVDTSIITSQTSIDTVLIIDGATEDIISLPVDYTEAIQTIDNDRYTAKFQYQKKGSMVRASVKLKEIYVPVKMHQETKLQKHITWSDNTKTEIKKKDKQTERTPSVNWNWVIPITICMILLFVILFFKTKKLFTL